MSVMPVEDRFSKSVALRIRIGVGYSRKRAAQHVPETP